MSNIIENSKSAPKCETEGCNKKAHLEDICDDCFKKDQEDDEEEDEEDDEEEVCEDCGCDLTDKHYNDVYGNMVCDDCMEEDEEDDDEDETCILCSGGIGIIICNECVEKVWLKTIR